MITNITAFPFARNSFEKVLHSLIQSLFVCQVFQSGRVVKCTLDFCLPNGVVVIQLSLLVSLQR